MNEPTPGPWVSRPTAGHDIHGQSVVYPEADGKDIAIVYDGKANGNLIAAAPEMLKALKDVKAWFIHLEEGADESDPLRALRKRFHAGVHRILDEAIQKAEGGQ